MNGVQNIVAPQGTAFTEQHARILKRYANEVVLCFDSDNAGQNAAVRALDHLLAADLAVRVAIVPAPHDPDSFIKANGGVAFSEVIRQAEGFFDYYLNRLCATHEIASDKGRLAILQAMATAVHKTENRVLIDAYAQKTALRLGVAAEAVRAEFKKSHVPPIAARTSEEEPLENTEPAVEFIRPSPIELHLLKLLLLHDELAETTSQHLEADWIQHSQVRQIVAQRLAIHEQGVWQSLAEFLENCESAPLHQLITEAVMEARPIPNPETQLRDIMLKLRNQHLDRQIGLLTQQASQPELAEEARVDLLREQIKLKQEKRSPLAALQK